MASSINNRQSYLQAGGAGGGDAAYHGTFPDGHWYPAYMADEKEQEAGARLEEVDMDGRAHGEMKKKRRGGRQGREARESKRCKADEETIRLAAWDTSDMGDWKEAGRQVRKARERKRCKAGEEPAGQSREASDIEAWKVARTKEEQGRLGAAILSRADYDQIKRGFSFDYKRMQREEPASVAEEVGQI